jgi:hypothetical protein
MKRLRIRENSESQFELSALLAQAIPLARPKAFFLECGVTARGEDWVEIDGVRFTSRVLSVNLKDAYRVFPFLATCGLELQVWANGVEAMLHRFWAEAIKEAALFSALDSLNQCLEERFHPGKTTSMNPGSLEDWPIQQQTKLFALFGEMSSELEVTLTGSLLMVPTKSVSGIRFPTEVSFESCQLCPRADCPGRRAPYDAELYQSRYCPVDG